MLELIKPSTAQQPFIGPKATTCSEATVRNYRYRLDQFVEWYGQKELLGVASIPQMSC